MNIQVHPDWDIFQSFLTGKLHSAMRTDGSENTRPMTYYVENPRGVQGLFDNIAYAKCKFHFNNLTQAFYFHFYNVRLSFTAGSVLRMFLHALGESTFKKGLKYYLTKK